MSTTEWKPLYKVGDKLRVIDRKYGHGFGIGEEVTVSAVINGHYQCEVKDDYWYLREDELELISKN